MKYLNLELVHLRSSEYLGSDPLDRATWLCLLAWCADQENGGRIAGAGRWKDRRWQQLVGVTEDEVRRPSELWTWTDDDLEVAFYPREQEAATKARRSNGALGGRPPVENPREKPNPKPSLEPSPEPTAKRNVMEGKGREGKVNSSPPIVPPPSTSRPASRPTTTTSNLVTIFQNLHPEDVDAFGPAPPNSPTPEHPRWQEFAGEAGAGDRFAQWLTFIYPEEAAELAKTPLETPDDGEEVAAHA